MTKLPVGIQTFREIRDNKRSDPSPSVGRLIRRRTC